MDTLPKRLFHVDLSPGAHFYVMAYLPVVDNKDSVIMFHFHVETQIPGGSINFYTMILSTLMHFLPLCRNRRRQKCSLGKKSEKS